MIKSKASHKSYYCYYERQVFSSNLLDLDMYQPDTLGRELRIAIRNSFVPYVGLINNHILKVYDAKV